MLGILRLCSCASCSENVHLLSTRNSNDFLKQLWCFAHRSFSCFHLPIEIAKLAIKIFTSRRFWSSFRLSNADYVRLNSHILLLSLLHFMAICIQLFKHKKSSLFIAPLRISFPTQHLVFISIAIVAFFYNFFIFNSRRRFAQID